MATINFSLFTCCFRRFLGVHSRVLFATRTPNSHNHSYVHYSLSKFTGEWFTNHSNHIHRFTPITRIVATKDLSVGKRHSRTSYQYQVPLKLYLGPQKKSPVRTILRTFLSGPLRLRVQSRSRTRMRITVSIASLFRTCFKGVLDTIAPLSRG